MKNLPPRSNNIGNFWDLNNKSHLARVMTNVSKKTVEIKIFLDEENRHKKK